MKQALLIIALMFQVSCACDKQVKLLDASAFETEVDGKQVALYTLRGGDLVAQVTNYGGRVVSLWAPDRDGNYADVEIGYESIDRYINNTGERFLGASVGPVANRIGNARFTLEGKEHHLPANDNGCNTLHGGNIGIDRIVWEVKEVDESRLTLLCTLPDGQEGFPGNRTIEMTYELTPQNEFNVSFTATTDCTTVINLAHHPFFNLEGDGEGTILDHVMQIYADHITPVDAKLIPTGELMAVEGTPFDFREPHTIGERIDADHPQLTFGAGYDHNWVVSLDDDKSVRKMVDLYSPKSGRGLEMWSDQVAVQFYSGNFFDGSYCSKYGKPILRRGAIVLEAQRYPDSPNQPAFPSIVLTPEQVYTHFCSYKFYTK